MLNVMFERIPGRIMIPVYCLARQKGGLVNLRLLGEFELSGGEGNVSRPKSRKGRLLVAYLALHPPHCADRRRLADLLYPDADAAHALFSLRQELSSLRREVPRLSPSLLAPDSQTLELRVEDLHVDVAEFRRLVRAEPSRAIALYGGPLLAGSGEEWLLPLRAELEQALLGALETLADRADPLEAAAWLRRCQEIDPYSERVLRKLLGRLAEAGDPAAVSVAYRRFQFLLHRDLHLRPANETTKFYLKLINERPGSITTGSEPRRRARRAPAPTTPLFGRESDIAAVCRRLQEGRMVSLIGPGGVGKTRLAIAVGEASMERFPAGVHFVDLSALSDPNLVPQTIGLALGLREPPDRDWTDSVAEACEGAPVLLILDNCEQLIEACAAVAGRLLGSCPSLSVLATSRIPCRLAQEQRVPVEPLTLPPDERLPAWVAYSAIAMFQSRASRANPHFAVTEANLPLVIKVCRQVDATPLGIEMAAATLASLPLEELAQRVERSLTFLKATSAETPARQRTQSAVIDASYSLLDDEDRVLLRKLSVFSGGWTLEHIEDAFGGSVIDSVVRLVDASLVQMRSGGYALFETVRQFGLEHLRALGEEAETRDAHLQCMIRRHSRVRESWHSQDAALAADRYEGDLDNVRSALEWSIESGATEDGLRLVANAAIVMGMLGLDSCGWLDRLLAIEVSDPASPARMAALRTACWAYGAAGYGVSRGQAWRRALAAVEELASLSRAEHDEVHLAWSLTWLGFRLFPGDPERARLALDEALLITSGLADRSYETTILMFMSWHAAFRAAYTEAEDLAGRAMALAKDRRDPNMVSGITTLRGYLPKEQGRYDEARVTLLEARKLASENRSDYAERHASLLLAELYVDCRDGVALAHELRGAKAREFADHLDTAQVALLSRYSEALEGATAAAFSRLDELIATFVRRAEELPSQEYRWAGLGLELATRCLVDFGRRDDAARVLGAAQTMSERDSAAVSPSMQLRWAHLALLVDCDEIVEEGKQLSAYQAVGLVKKLAMPDG